MIDPMLCEKGMLPPFARFRHKSRKNPLVSLPENAPEILKKITYCLITHSQKFGVKALQHTDHLDAVGEAFLRENDIPVGTREQDVSYLKKYGLTVDVGLIYWQPTSFLEGEITAVPALHGHSWIHNLMANGSGFYLQLPNEPTIYISGDTVYTKNVERVLTELKPDIAVMASGSASLDISDPILMPLEELVTFVQTSPKIVVANHLEALNHCPTSRSQLKQTLEQKGLMSKTFIPNDGETLSFDKDELSGV